MKKATRKLTAKVRTMRLQGKSWGVIARALGIQPRTARTWFAAEAELQEKEARRARLAATMREQLAAYGLDKGTE